MAVELWKSSQDSFFWISVDPTEVQLRLPQPIFQTLDSMLTEMIMLSVAVHKLVLRAYACPGFGSISISSLPGFVIFSYEEDGLGHLRTT